MYEEDSENKIDKRTEIMDDVDEHEGECRQQSSYDAQDVNWTTPNRTSCPEDHAPEKNTSGRASEERTFPEKSASERKTQWQESRQQAPGREKTYRNEYRNEYREAPQTPTASASAETEGTTTAQIPETKAASDGQSTTPVSTVTDVSSIAEKAMPSLVAINDTMTVEQNNFFGMPQTYQAQSSGSGIIVGQNDTELLIATNNHVVSGATDMKVTFTDSTQVAAAVKGTDSATDLAIIAVKLSDIPSDTMSKIKVSTLGDSDKVKVGEQVIAIGNALGYGQSLTVGYISALDREITDENGIQHTYIQTDAAINPGNSGGALLDLNGNVIGINAAKNASTEVEGMGFAIPISKAQEILNNLMTKKTREAVDESAQGYLGIQGTNIDANASKEYGMPVGIYVYKIVEGGAAANSDLKEKDIITKFDGQSVTNMEELKQMLTYYEGGSTVELTVQSLVNGAYVEHNVQITLGTKPASNS